MSYNNITDKCFVCGEKGDRVELFNIWLCKKHKYLQRKCGYYDADDWAREVGAEFYLKNKNNVDGICPICGSSKIDYKEKYFIGKFITLKWYCKNCQVSGKELYKLEFQKNTIEQERRLDV